MYVCDASVLFKLLVVEDGSEQAEALLLSSEIAAPELVFAEIGNVLWTRVRSGRLDAEDARLLMERLHTLPIDTRPIRPFIARALSHALALGHPVYDCLYLALAESLAVPLITADQRFMAAIRRANLKSIEVKALADLA